MALPSQLKNVNIWESELKCTVSINYLLLSTTDYVKIAKG